MKKLKNVLIEATAWIVVFLMIIAIVKYIIYG
jgi:hypothetical protein